MPRLQFCRLIDWTIQQQKFLQIRKQLIGEKKNKWKNDEWTINIYFLFIFTGMFKIVINKNK